MSLADRMKLYEQDTLLTPGLPVIVRLDGRAFHTFTKGLEKPFDFGFMNLMADVTKSLVEEAGAVVGYTQSDEISLIITQPYFSGRVQKIVSVLASKAAVEFNALIPKYLPSKIGEKPLFDARVFVVPNQEEAVNCLLWRENDATKNSILAVAQANFSHKSLQGLDLNQQQEKLWREAGVNWNSYPDFAKRGSYFAKRSILRVFSAEEIDKLPPKHAARKNPELKVERTEIVRLNLPPIASIKNRVEVLFSGEAPIIRST